VTTAAIFVPADRPTFRRPQRPKTPHGFRLPGLVAVALVAAAAGALIGSRRGRPGSDGGYADGFADGWYRASTQTPPSPEY